MLVKASMCCKAPSFRIRTQISWAKTLTNSWSSSKKGEELFFFNGVTQNHHYYKMGLKALQERLRIKTPPLWENGFLRHHCASKHRALSEVVHGT